MPEAAAGADTAAPAVDKAAPAAAVLTCIQDCVRHFWERLGTRDRVQFRMRPHTIRVGTACSGTDSVVHVLKSLGDIAGWKFEHVFSCECSENKRRWLKDNFPTLPHIFTDVTELHKGMAFDAVTGAVIAVPGVDLFVAGFVCKSVSSENAQRMQFADCIGRSSGLTGETFRGVEQFCRKYQPAVVICENVSGLLKRVGQSEPPIAAVRREFSTIGYFVGHAMLDTRKFLLPQRRNRCWIWAILDRSRGSKDVRSSDCLEHGRSSGCRESRERKLSSSVSAILSHFESQRPISLGDFLASSLPARDKEEDFVTGGRAALSDRERHVVNAAIENARRQLQEQRPLQRLQEDPDIVVDVSKSLGRAPWCIGAATCVLPNSRLFWAREDRATRLANCQVLLSKPRCHVGLVVLLVERVCWQLLEFCEHPSAGTDY